MSGALLIGLRQTFNDWRGRAPALHGQRFNYLRREGEHFLIEVNIGAQHRRHLACGDEILHLLPPRNMALHDAPKE